MSAKPYSEADLASIRDIVRRVPVTDGTVEHWLATVDALQSRLAAAEAERDALRAALAAQPAQAGGGDACCLFCRTELDPDEMDDGSDLPPLAPGVCSECFQRWHDEPVWRKRLKEATDKPAQAGEAVVCLDCDAGHPRWVVPENGNVVHTLPGGMVNFCAAPSRPGGASQEQAGEAVARAVRQADLVPYNTPQEYDVACAQRAACEMAALNSIDAMRPGGAS